MKRIIGAIGFIAFVGIIEGCGPRGVDGVDEEEAVALAEGAVDGHAVYFHTIETGGSSYTTVLVCKEEKLYPVLVDDTGNVGVSVDGPVELVYCSE